MLPFSLFMLAGAAQAQDTLIAIATDQDVFIHDVDGAGHPSGAQGVGPSTVLARSGSGLLLFGAGAGSVLSPYPWRMMAGNTGVASATGTTRAASAGVLASNATGTLLWGSEGDELVVDWHPNPAIQDHRWSPGWVSGGPTWISLAVDPSDHELWAVAAGGVLYRYDLATNTAAAWGNTTLHHALVAAHPASGVVVAGRETLHDYSGEPEPFGFLRHRNGDLVESERLDPFDGNPLALEVDQAAERAWVLTDAGELQVYALGGGFTLLDDWQLVDPVDLALDQRGAAWVLTENGLYSVVLGDPAPTASPASWTGKAQSIAALHTRPPLTALSTQGTRLRALQDALWELGIEGTLVDEETFAAIGESPSEDLRAAAKEAAAAMVETDDLGPAVLDFIAAEDRRAALQLLELVGQHWPCPSCEEALASGGACPSCPGD